MSQNRLITGICTLNLFIISYTSYSEWSANQIKISMVKYHKIKKKKQKSKDCIITTSVDWQPYDFSILFYSLFFSFIEIPWASYRIVACNYMCFFGRRKAEQKCDVIEYYNWPSPELDYYTKSRGPHDWMKIRWRPEQAQMIKYRILEFFYLT